MVDPSWNQHGPVTDFGGALTALSRITVPIQYAKSCQNIVFRHGKAATRRGFGPTGITVVATSARNFTPLGEEYLLTHRDGTGIQYTDITAGSPSPTTLFSGTSSVSAVFAPYKDRCYAALADSAQAGIHRGQVIVQKSTLTSDNILPPPSTVTGTITEPAGTGRVSAGVHYFGYLAEYRNGALVRSPDTASSAVCDYSTFLPQSFTSAGGKKIQWALTGLDSKIVAVHPIMTAVTNRGLWLFVPDGRVDVSGGAATMTIDVSDNELRAAAEHIGGLTGATDYLLQIAETTNGTTPNTEPFKPHNAFIADDRLVLLSQIEDYGATVGSVWVSQKGRHQFFTHDQSRIFIGESSPAINGMMLNSQLWLFGIDWAAEVTITSGAPVEWQVDVFDNSHGAISTRSIAINSERNIAWVANRSGLFAFSGRFSSKPSNYNQLDLWNTIDWSLSYKIQVVDDPINNIVHVFAPVISGGLAWWTWNYEKGVSWDRVNFSPFTTASFTGLAGGVLVKNKLSGVSASNNNAQEMWVFSSTSAEMRRYKSEQDSNPYRDSTASAIQAFWETGKHPQGGALFNDVVAATVDVRGSGTCTLTASDLTGTVTQSHSLTLDNNTVNAKVMKEFGISTPAGGLKFETNAADHYMEINEFTLHTTLMSLL